MLHAQQQKKRRRRHGRLPVKIKKAEIFPVAEGGIMADKTLAGFLPSGIRFGPTDQELVVGFLSQKLGGDGEPSGDWARFSDALIPTVDLYGGDGAYPWRVCQLLAYPYGVGSTEFYCFTPRRKKYDGGICNPDRTVGSGTWTANGGDHHIYHRGVLVGHKVHLTFKMPPPGTGGGQSNKKLEKVNTHWVMHEYKLEWPGFQEMVLCRVRNQKKEHDEAKDVWVTPWWEQLQEASCSCGGGGNCSSSKKRKVASPLCEDAASPAQQQRRGLGQRASSKSKELQEIAALSPVIGIMEDDSELQRQQQDVLLAPPVVSPSAAVSPFSIAASSDDKVQGFSPLTGGLGADWDELLQVAMDYYSEAASIDSHVPLLQQPEQRDVCNATLLTEPVLTDASSTLHVGAVNACSSDEDVPPISLTTGAGNGCWTSDMELLYCEDDVALNVGDRRSHVGTSRSPPPLP
ncbi:hypothetical protein Taro_006112 [Colocasia esculenta]|uniref:NAC domain-containing protein n=1 Tax=Colocasia esculenta TaxID=4460 RepID=A0A843TUE8_COLES|nr:hypothetical protein [Colocasia esculenta]